MTKYVRLKFSEEEYKQVKKYADSSNLLVNRYIQSEILNKEAQPFYFYHLIIVLLESISEDVQKNNYNENTSKIFFYLYLIEQILQDKI